MRPVAAATERGARELELEALALDRDVLLKLPARFGEGRLVAVAVASGEAWRMPWEFPWCTLRDDFDADHDVAEWHGTNVFRRDGDEVYRRRRGARVDLELPRHHPIGGAERRRWLDEHERRHAA